MSVEIEKKARVSENDFLNVEKQLNELYGAGGIVKKVDYMYKNTYAEGNKTLRLRKANNNVQSTTDDGIYELCSKIKSTAEDGTEVNEELETTIRIGDVDAFKKALENAGLSYHYSKEKSGYEWTIPMKTKGRSFTLHAELLTVTSDNGYKDYFLEIEYTGDCTIELNSEFVSGRISEVFNKLNLTNIETKKYVELILKS